MLGDVALDDASVAGASPLDVREQLVSTPMPFTVEVEIETEQAIPSGPHSMAFQEVDLSAADAIRTYGSSDEGCADETVLFVDFGGLSGLGSLGLSSEFAGEAAYTAETQEIGIWGAGVIEQPPGWLVSLGSEVLSAFPDEVTSWEYRLVANGWAPEASGAAGVEIRVERPEAITPVRILSFERR